MPLPLIERVLILEQEVTVMRGRFDIMVVKMDKIEGLLTEFNAQRMRLKEKMKKARAVRQPKRRSDKEIAATIGTSTAYVRSCHRDK